jgi:peptide chain release factor 3
MTIQKLPYRHIRWVEVDTFKPDNFSITMDTILVEDKNRNPVLLFQNEWSIRHLTERNKGLELRETSI